MKKIILLTLVLALMLSGCMGGLIRNPDTMADGTPWDDSWTNMAGRLGVEQPGGDFRLLTTNGTLEGLQVQYATWVCGEETEVEKDTYVYDGQIYLMTEVCGTADQAEQTRKEWQEKFGGDLQITERESITVDGAEYELLHYDCLAADSHFARGVTALWTYGDMMLVVDIACAEGLDLDLTGTMERFIRGIHYA